MRYGHRDPKDTHSPRRARRQEFDAAFGASLLLAFALREAAGSGLIEGLRHLYDFAVQNAEYTPTPQDPEFGDIDFDSMIDASSILGPGFESVSVGEAMDIHAQLFPPGSTDADAVHAGTGLAVAGMHSALEGYFKAVAKTEVKGNFPTKALRPWLEAQRPPRTLDSRLFEALLDLDATRHVVVHNAGIVNESFIRQVPGTQLLIGEQRPVPIRLALHFAAAVSRLADLIEFIDSD